MALVKREAPFAGLSTLHTQLDDMFNSFFNSATQQASVGLATMDVYSDDDKSLTAEQTSVSQYGDARFRMA